jgi:hypothetical protein
VPTCVVTGLVTLAVTLEVEPLEVTLDSVLDVVIDELDVLLEVVTIGLLVTTFVDVVPPWTIGGFGGSRWNMPASGVEA